MKEKWKQIQLFDNEFYVSSEGRVKNSLTGNFIKGDINNFGYYRVTLWSKGRKKRIFRHRLVAENFIPNPKNKRFVNHKDGNKRNNSLRNLEWVTQSENEKHAFKNGLKQKTNKPFNVEFANGEVKTFLTQKEGGEYFKISQTIVGKWLKGTSLSYNKHSIVKIYFIKA